MFRERDGRGSIYVAFALFSYKRPFKYIVLRLCSQVVAPGLTLRFCCVPWWVRGCCCRGMMVPDAAGLARSCTVWCL